jgi:hypothetical protein
MYKCFRQLFRPAATMSIVRRSHCVSTLLIIILLPVSFGCLLRGALVLGQNPPNDPAQHAAAADHYYAEIQRHALSHSEKVEEQKIVFKDGGSVIVRHYTADHCTEIIKIEGAAPSQSVWLFDFPKDATPVHPSQLGKKRQDVGPPPLTTSGATPPIEHPTLKLAFLSGAATPASLRRAMFQGACLNPHPGPFVWSATPPDPNGFQVFNRSWPDGCAHWQVHNVYSGGWGPINWTSCVHY